MKKLFLLVILIILSINWSFSQTPYKCLIGNPYNTASKIIGRYNGHYFLNNGLEIDSLSNSISSHVWNSHFGYFYDNDIEMGNDLRYIIAREASSNSMVIKADTSGIILWTKIFSNTSPTAIIVPLSDGGYIFSDSYYSYPAFYKIDSFGNPIWHKCSFLSGYYSRQISETVDGGLLYNLSPLTSYGSTLIKVDESGNFLWCKTYPLLNGYLKNSISNDDGTISILGFYNFTHNNSYENMFLMKLDSSGNFIWAKSYGDFSNNDNSYFIDGQSLRHTTDNGYIISKRSTNQDLTLLKTDSFGNLEWTRTHGYSLSYETAGDAIQTSDSGYFVIASTYQPFTPIEGNYFIKTDSHGFVGCQEYTDTIITTNIFITDSSIVVLDSSLSMQVMPGTATDSMLILPSVIDGCTLGVINLDLNSSSIQVYPNPTSGKVVIKTTFVTKSEINILLYNSMGQIILERTFLPENDLQLDLTGFSKGLYFIKVAGKDDFSLSKLILE